MRTFSVNYPETIPAMSNLSPEAFKAEARLAMAGIAFMTGLSSSL